jgi:hypothetical protein
MKEMDIVQFKKKYKKLIERKAIKFSPIHPYLTELPYYKNLSEEELEKLEDMFVTIERRNAITDEIFAEEKELELPTKDILEVGYKKVIGVGIYKKRDIRKQNKECEIPIIVVEVKKPKKKKNGIHKKY